MLTSVVFCGMLLGVYSLGVLADHLGRRRGFLASALLLGVAGLASAMAPSFGVRQAARPALLRCSGALRLWYHLACCHPASSIA